MKYKIIAAVLAAVFAVGMLAACQREKEPYPSYYDNTTSQPTASDMTGDATEPETTLPSTEFEPETSRPTEETAPSKSESESNTEPKTNSAVEPKNYSFKTLMLVNPTHSVPDGYVESITLEKVQGSYVMDSRCAEPMRDMIAAAKRDGITLQLCSTFRTYETQKKLYENRIKILMNRDSSLTYEQAAEKAYIKKQADEVSVIVMNPQNGELMAMVNYPEFNLNEPFTLIEEMGADGTESADKKQELLNRMWRNPCISDTYEPGSTFKIITAAAALEEGVVKLDDAFFCPGYKIVEDRRIRCARTTGHGAETFETGIMNSCNPVFMELGERLGAENFAGYFKQFGLLSKTNIDLPGEAGTIMHKTENIGPVELATISFGQSFQITPIQLVTTVSSIINGGTRVTPHFGVSVQDADGNTVKTFSYETHENICTAETSETMRYLLEKVVSEGTGKNAKIEGFSIGGKTATSQTLPRSDHKYISSFLGFAPADNPQVLVLVVINNPQGIYYGGTIAAPVAKEIFENILPYLDK